MQFVDIAPCSSPERPYTPYTEGKDQRGDQQPPDTAHSGP